MIINRIKAVHWKQHVFPSLNSPRGVFLKFSVWYYALEMEAAQSCLFFFFLISPFPSPQWKQVKFGSAGWPRELAEDKARVWSGFLVARQHWSRRWQQGTQQGHQEGWVQPKGWPWNDAGMSPQTGISHWALLLEPEWTCRRASQRVLFHGFQLGLRKCSISCTFK